MEKGYQEYEDLVGTVSLKVKGVGESAADGLVYDSEDLVRPPIESDAVFITASQIVTSQERGVTEADKYSGMNKNYHCDHTAPTQPNCTEGLVTANGITTGDCGESDMCMVRAWEPLENSADEEKLLGVDKFTIYAKADITFPSFGYKFTNSPNGTSDDTNTYSVKDILTACNTTYADILKQKKVGAIIVASFKYDCDLNNDKETCVPEVEFERLDGNNGPDTTGFNYRYQSKKITDTGNETRKLYKLNGIRIVFQLYGKAGKFSIIPLLLALGSGIGLLSVSTVVCDFMLEYVTEAKDKYTHYKFTAVKEPDGRLNSNGDLNNDLEEDILTSTNSYRDDLDEA